MSLNLLAIEIYGISRSKGFWIIPEGDHEVSRNPFEVLTLIHSEVSEACEAMRDGKWEESSTWHATPETFGPDLRLQGDGVWTDEDFPRKVTDQEMLSWNYVPKPEGVGSELADVIIRVLDACGAWEIDIEKAVRDKIRYNATREYKHGRAR